MYKFQLVMSLMNELISEKYMTFHLLMTVQKNQ